MEVSSAFNNEVEVHLHVWLTFRQKLTDLDWSVTRQFVPTCRYSTGSQALAFHMEFYKKALISHPEILSETE